MTRCWEAALSLLASVYLKISSRQREEAKEKRSVFPPPPWFICFPKAWRLPPVLPHSQTCLHSPESVTALTVLPFLFLIMLLLLILPVPSPILPPPLPFFFTEADTVQKKSTMGCIKQPCRLRISPENTKQPLICFPPSSPLTRISRSAPWGFNSPHKKREAEKVVS